MPRARLPLAVYPSVRAPSAPRAVFGPPDPSELITRPDNRVRARRRSQRLARRDLGRQPPPSQPRRIQDDTPLLPRLPAPDPEPTLEFRPQETKPAPRHDVSLFGVFAPQEPLLAIPSAGHSVTLRTTIPGEERRIWPLLLMLALTIVAGFVWMGLALQYWS